MPIRSDPPISAPPTIEGPAGLRLVQQMANNIRQRLFGLDTAYNALEARFNSAQSSNASAALGQQVAVLTQQVNALAALVRTMRVTPASSGITTIIMEIEGEPGEDGLTIPGQPGAKGEPGQIIFIAGDDSDEETPFSLT